MKARASVYFDGELAVHEIRVIEHEDRLIVAMPSRRDAHGRFVDIVHPLSGSIRAELNEAVLSAYKKALKLHEKNEEDKKQEKHEKQ